MTERLHFHFSLSCIGEGNGSPLQCPCLENPRDKGAWWAAIYGVTQSRTRLMGLSRWLRGKESAASAGDLSSIHPWVRKIPWRRKWQHSSILACEIPWTEEPGLQSMGSQRVGHDSATKQQHAEFIRPSLIQSKVRNEYFTQRIPHFKIS